MINRRFVTAGSLVGALIMLSAAIPAAAQWNKPVTVKAGTKAIIHHVATFRTTGCGPGPIPKITRMQAKHGKLESGFATGTLGDGQCKGKQARFLVFRYTPDAGFRGKDTALIYYTFPLRDGMPRKQASGGRISIIVE